MSVCLFEPLETIALLGRGSTVATDSGSLRVLRALGAAVATPHA
jgi:hypothetical protein